MLWGGYEQGCDPPGDPHLHWGLPLPRLYLEYSDNGPQQRIKVLPVRDCVSGVSLQAELAAKEVHAQDADGRRQAAVSGGQGWGHLCLPAWHPVAAPPCLPLWLTRTSHCPWLSCFPFCRWGDQDQDWEGQPEDTLPPDSGWDLRRPPHAASLGCPPPQTPPQGLSPRPGCHAAATKPIATVSGCPAPPPIPPFSSPLFLGSPLSIHLGVCSPPTRCEPKGAEPSLGSHMPGWHTRGLGCCLRGGICGWALQTL